jgi:aromatic-L-amino-acid decarboxylase
MAALPEGRWVLEGAEQADSITVNPHKWLFVPLDFSILYLAEPESLRAVFALTPEYLEGDASPINKASDGRAAAVDYMDYGIQLGRRFRALKAWMVLRAFGRAGIQSRLREHCRLAALFASWISERPDFELSAPQQMAVVCFRFVNPALGEDACDRANSSIVERVNASGDAYLTYTRVRNRVCMRIGVGNILTTEAHLRHAWRRILEESSRGAEV